METLGSNNSSDIIATMPAQFEGEADDHHRIVNGINRHGCEVGLGACRWG